MDTSQPVSDATKARILADLQDFWRVDDSEGNHYGTFDRYTASVLADRVWRENPHFRWVGITKVEPVGSCH